MQYYYRYYFALLTFLFLFLIVPARTNAVIYVPDLKLKMDPKIISCAIIANKYDERSEQLEQSRTKHIEVYSKLVDRLETMVSKWNGWGYDTDDIEGDIEQLEELIQEYKEDFDDLEDKISIAKEACGDTDYASKLSAAKASLKEVRGDVVDIRVLYQTEIRKNILELKKQII